MYQGFSHFLVFLPHFLLVKLAISSIRVNGTLLHHYLVNFVVNSYVSNPVQFLKNDNFIYLLVLIPESRWFP